MREACGWAELTSTLVSSGTMTGAQTFYLTTLCEEGLIYPPAGNLGKAQASKLIDELKAKLGR